MSDQPRQTPRTHEEAHRLSELCTGHASPGDIFREWRWFSEKLELESDARAERIAKITLERDEARASLDFQMKLSREVIEREKETHREVERLRKENAKLREALGRLVHKNADGRYFLYEMHDRDVTHIVSQALAGKDMSNPTA